MKTPPSPVYDYETNKIVRQYKNAIKDILAEFDSVDLLDFDRAESLIVLKSVSKILKDLDEYSSEWVKTNITLAMTHGIERSLLTLGIVSNISSTKAVKFNSINKEFARAIIADTQTDLLAVTTNVERKVRAAVRQVTGEVLRRNVSVGINSTQTLRRDIVKGLKQTLGKSVETGIIDAAGRRWKPEHYVNVLVQTKMMEAHKESTINEALGRNVFYGVISTHGAKDMCRVWENKIVKFTPDAPGDYPYIKDLPKRDIFHPCCKHVVSPVRNPAEYEA